MPPADRLLVFFEPETLPFIHFFFILFTSPLGKLSQKRLEGLRLIKVGCAPPDSSYRFLNLKLSALTQISFQPAPLVMSALSNGDFLLLAGLQPFRLLLDGKSIIQAAEYINQGSLAQRQKHCQKRLTAAPPLSRPASRRGAGGALPRFQPGHTNFCRVCSSPFCHAAFGAALSFQHLNRCGAWPARLP